MAFQKGHKGGKGGKREGAGAKTKQHRMLRIEAEAYARQHLYARIDKFLEVFEKCALGVKRRKRDTKTGAIYYEIEYDTGNQRHALNILIPPINKTEMTGKDGRPLVPVTIVAPDPNGPIPSVTDSNEKPAKEDMH